MIKFENTEITGFIPAIRGMRNPMNSWKKIDSGWTTVDDYDSEKGFYDGLDKSNGDLFVLGPKDLDLMKRLRVAGTDHRKYLRMIQVYVDITAPLYWWKEFDTYKVGTVANSCSTMHKIHAKEFTPDDFSTEHLLNMYNNDANDALFIENTRWDSDDVLDITIKVLNFYRMRFLETKDKRYWWQMIQLLPSSYNQKRTVMMNYETLNNIYKSRKHHKLDEWKIGFMEWIESLPYAAELITDKYW